MFKFLYILIFPLILNLIFLNSGHTAAKADEFQMPASYPRLKHSGLETATTWVADHHQGDEKLMRRLCWQSTFTDPENSDSMKAFLPVQNNPGDS